MTTRQIVVALIILAVVCAVILFAFQRPARAAPVTQFIGDRYAPQMAQGASARDVTRSLRERRALRPRGGKRQRVPVPRPRPSLSLAAVVAPLAAKAREIQAACGSRVISAVRFTRIAGTGGRLSLHASGRAVDIAGNPACIYSRLRGWPGGVSVDYGRVRHVHISYAPGGAEWGVRFNHYRKRR